MKVWKVILATLVIFAAGFVVGGVVLKQPQQVPVPSPQPPPAPPLPPYIQERFLQNMKRELNLTPDQMTRLQAVFAESRERMSILMDLINPELQAEKREVSEKIRNELTPEQRAKFEELIKRPHRGDAEGRGRRGTSNPAEKKPGKKGPSTSPSA